MLPDKRENWARIKYTTEPPNFNNLSHFVCLEEFIVIGRYSIWLNGTLEVVVNLQWKPYGDHTRYPFFNVFFLLCLFPLLSKLRLLIMKISVCSSSVDSPNTHLCFHTASPAHSHTSKMSNSSPELVRNSYPHSLGS